MSKIVILEPEKYPRKTGESWWVVHPNTRGSEFKLPFNAVTACTEDFLKFRAGTIYNVWEARGSNSGWVGVACGDLMYEMPEYLFARYFDAEAFVIGSANPLEIEGAKPFNYKPTLPAPEKRQLELFNDRGKGI